MFQRLKGELKGAFDTIADEQARLRAQQAAPARSRGSPRPKPTSGELSGPDPDPNQFSIGKDPAVATPDTSNATGSALETAVPAENAIEMKTDQGQDTSDPSQTNGQDGGGGSDASPDVQAKLRRLSKLESKYSELLKAYRRAHARNSLIEPFEARLRESTPLTSISDPNAFVEYLGQLISKGDMVMDEFKKVSADRDTLKRKLEEADRKTKEAYDEITQIKLKQSDSDDTPLKTARLSATSGDKFSFEDEVPRLQGELKQKSDQIAQLEVQNDHLKVDLASTRESAEQMMQDLEKAQQGLESVRTEMTRSDNDKKQQIQELQNTISDIETELASGNTAKESAEGELIVMQARITDLERLQLQQDQEQEQERERDLSPEPAAAAPEAQAEGGNKKKNKKRKKKGGAGGTEAVMPIPVQQNISITKPPTSTSGITVTELQDKDAAIDRLHSKLKAQEDLTDEIETLKEELSIYGQDNVEFKDRIKQLEAEKMSLQARVDELESQLSGSAGGPASSTQLVELTAEKITLAQKVSSLEAQIADHQSQSSARSSQSDALVKEFEALRLKSKSLEVDLSAAQQLAASRYKEMTSLRDLLHKAQPELISLRTEVSDLKASRDELATRNKELRKLELREESLRSDIESLKRDAFSKDAEIRSLNQKVSQETTTRIAAEESNRRSQRDLQRAQGERMDAVTIRDATTSELSQTKSQLEDARSRLEKLDRQVAQLNSEVESLRDEMTLKTAQHVSAESLMSSVRDQAAEMATQMKEARERCDSLEEELHDAHRLMSERGREGETMRRLLSEVEGRADSRIKEMRERMDMAIQERDRAEDEAASISRRRTREVEEAKSKLREVEREVRRVTDDKEDLERIERDLKRQRDDDTRRIEASTRELEEVRRAMAELRDALDDAEKQARDVETERSKLSRALEEAQQSVEKLQRSNKTLSEDIRALRATRIRPTDSPSISTRSSLESNRRLTSPVPNNAAIASPNSPAPSIHGISRSNTNNANSGTVDFVYLKNVLLQFLEQKDKAHQMQLVPVLSMLLRFDKRDQEKWSKAIAAR